MTTLMDLPKQFNQLDIRWQWENVIVAKPNLQGGDPFSEAKRIIRAPWSAPPFEAGTMVVDTITRYAEVFCDMSASSGKYAKNPIEFGRGDDKITVPTMGDYRAGQLMAQSVTDLAIDSLDMDLIVLGHEGHLAKGREGEAGFAVLQGGMATVGQAQVSSYGGQFDQYLRLKHRKKQDKQHVVCQMVGDATYQAKVREDGRKKPPSLVEVPNTLDEQLAWWADRFDEAGIDIERPERDGYLRTALYGLLGTGKTRLALSAPRRRIVYVAVDSGSEFLKSMFYNLKTEREES